MTCSDASLRNVYTSMIHRCYNKKRDAFPYYGGRGIRVCKRWRKGDGDKSGYGCFVEDMAPRPDGLTIERKDNDKDYTPQNCVWSSFRDQCRNRRSNVQITHNSKTMCLEDWSLETGIHSETLRRRLIRGRTGNQLLAKPLGNLMTFRGKTQTVTALAREFGINEETARARFKRGLSPEKVLEAA